MAISTSRQNKLSPGKGGSSPKNVPLDQKTVDRKVLMTATEIKYARCLAENEVKTRTKAMKALRKWFSNRNSFLPYTEADLMLIWKGLFYSMWMSDKPLVQEECAENIASLTNVLDNNSGLLFFKCGLQTLSNEWFGIDQLRLDKFLMLTRRLVRHTLLLLHTHQWSKPLIHCFTSLLSTGLLSPSSTTSHPLGLQLHLTEVYLEEVAKVSQGSLTSRQVTALVRPMVSLVCGCSEGRLMGHVARTVFRYLMVQSERGQEWGDQYNAWRMQGFPGGDISHMQRELVDSDSDSETAEAQQNGDVSKALDPRAGHVDVELPQLKFNPHHLAKLLEANKFTESGSARNRKCVTKLINEFQTLSKGKYPLGNRTVELPETDKHTLKKSVNRLVKFEKDLMSGKITEDATSETVGKKSRKRKRSNKEVTESSETTATVDTEKKQKKPNNNNNKEVVKKAKLDKVVQKKTNNLNVNDYEFRFIRNSGIWYVYSSDKGTKGIKGTKGTKETKETKETKGITGITGKQRKRSVSSVTMTRDELMEVKVQVESDCGVPSSNGMTPKRAKLTPAGLAALYNTPSNDVEEEGVNASVNSSGKKVKIDLKLNRSQEVHEHQLQILHSPAIPFDADRKPTKTLLKKRLSTALASPINPFPLKMRRRSLW